MPSVPKKQQTLQTVIANSSHEELQAYLRGFAQDLTSEIALADPERSEEVLSALIAELALSAADQRRRRERRERQAEGIAAAKARGVRFGRSALELPEDFDEFYQAWRSGEMSLRQAARSCGMAAATFHAAAQRKERAAECTT